MRLWIAQFLQVVSLSFVLAAGPASTAAQPTRGPNAVVEYIGRLEPARVFAVCLKTPGTVAELTVQEGQKVEQGDVICVLQKSAFEAAVSAAEMRCQIEKMTLASSVNGPAPQEIESARADVEVRSAEVDAARVQLQAMERRLTEQQASQEDVELARIALRAAEARKAKADAQLMMVQTGAREETIALQRARVELAQVELEQARQQLVDGTVHAPASGVVNHVYVLPGEHVTGTGTNGFRVCDIADPSRFHVVVTVPQEALASLAEGDRCNVEIPGFRDQLWSGRVSRILPSVEPAQGLIRVQVTINSHGDEASKPKLFAGLRATVRLATKPQIRTR